jgi:hypothetical protein
MWGRKRSYITGEQNESATLTKELSSSTGLQDVLDGRGISQNRVRQKSYAEWHGKMSGDGGRGVVKIVCGECRNYRNFDSALQSVNMATRLELETGLGGFYASD